MRLFEVPITSNPKCTRCERCQFVQHVCVPGEVVGDPPVRLVVVGEAPGREEDKQNRPFVGPSGKLLRELLSRFSVCYYITNSVKCFGDTPSLKEIAACSIYLRSELEEYPGVPVLAVGLAAAKALGYKDARMQAIVNTVTRSEELGRRVGFILHPAAYLRSPRHFKAVWDKAESTIAMLLEPEQRDISQEYKVVRDRLPLTMPTVWALDTETTGLDMFGDPDQKRRMNIKCDEERAEITALAIYDADTNTVYVLRDRSQIIKAIPMVLEWWLKNPPFAHNAKFDLHMLQQEALRHKYDVPLVVFPIRDTMVHVAVTNPDAPKGLARNLEALNIKRYWGAEKKYEVSDLTAYVAADTYGAYLLRQARIEAEENPEYHFLQRLAAVTQFMERIGIPISAAEAEIGIARCKSAIEAIIRETRLSEDTLRSPMKMSALIGIDSTNKQALADFAAREQDPQKLKWVKALQDYRKYQKLINYYTNVLALKTVNELGWDVVHAELNPVGAAGGRMSSSSFSKSFGLNLQNFPPEAKKVFQPPPGYVLIEADYSQIELRVVAMIANVKAMLEAFEAGEDLHSKTAYSIFGKVDPELRKKAKAINFGFLYGMSPEGFQQYLLGNFGMLISVEEAAEVRKRFFSAYPELLRYYKQVEQEVIRNGYVESLFGRRRYFVPTPEQIRAAINFKVQSTAAEICLRATIALAETLPGFGAFVVNQIHDSITFVVPEEKQEMLQQLIVDTMHRTELGWFPVETRVVQYTPTDEAPSPGMALRLF